MKGDERMKRLLMLIVIIIFGINVTGCNSSKIKFESGYDQMGGFGFKEVDGNITMEILEFIGSVKELKDICEQWGNPAFDQSSEFFSSEISEKIRSYDDSFFVDNTLIIYSFLRGHRNETRIDSISIEGEQITLNARYISKKGKFDDVEFNWLMLIEVKKEDILGSSTIQIKYK